MYVCVFCLFVFFLFVCCCFFLLLFFLFVFCFVFYVCSGFISSLSLLLSFIRVSLIIGVSLSCFTDEVEDSFYYDEALILNGFLLWLFFVLTFSIIIIFYSFCMVPQQSNFELQRQKPYRRTLASSEDSNQPAQSESSLGAFWISKDAKFLLVDNEDSDQTVRMSAGTFSIGVAHILICFMHFIMKKLCCGQF